MQPGEEKAQGDLINVWKYLKRGCKEDRASPFSVVPSDRTRGNVHTLKHRRFPPNIGKHFFTVQVTKHWHRLLKEVVEPPSLEIFKSHLDMVLGNPGSRWPCLSRGIGQDDLQRFLPTLTTSVIVCSHLLAHLQAALSRQASLGARSMEGFCDLPLHCFF